MAGKDVARLTGEALDEWYRRTPAQIEEERRRALAAGRAVWEAGTRSAQQVLGRTQSELEALGRIELGRTLREAAAQVEAIPRAAANKITLGKADNLSAAADAAIGLGSGEDFKARYRSNLEREHQRTKYDMEHRPVAKAAGDLVGEAIAWRAAGKGGAHVSARLPIKAKGTLGEALSAGKTILRADIPVGFQKPLPVKGGYTLRDHVTARGKSVEAKFGPTARLRPRQKEAQAQLGDLYRVDWWMPHHVGRITGAAGAGALWAGDKK